MSTELLLQETPRHREEAGTGQAEGSHIDWEGCSLQFLRRLLSESGFSRETEPTGRTYVGACERRRIIGTGRDVSRGRSVSWSPRRATGVMQPESKGLRAGEDGHPSSGREGGKGGESERVREGQRELSLPAQFCFMQTLN